MTDHRFPRQVAAAVLDNEPALVACPLCHTPGTGTALAIERGADWRCVRCGQRWDASRLAAVAAYTAWAVDGSSPSHTGRTAQLEGRT